MVWHEIKVTLEYTKLPIPKKHIIVKVFVHFSLHSYTGTKHTVLFFLVKCRNESSRNILIKKNLTPSSKRYVYFGFYKTNNKHI